MLWSKEQHTAHSNRSNGSWKSTENSSKDNTTVDVLNCSSFMGICMYIQSHYKNRIGENILIEHASQSQPTVHKHLSNCSSVHSMIQLTNG